MRLLLVEIPTPYLVLGLGTIIGAFGSFVKFLLARVDKNRELIDEHGRDLVAIKTSLKFYFESIGKGAAVVLDSPNPTPPRMRELLNKHVLGSLTPDERAELVAWLKTVRNDNTAKKSERSAAITLLASMGAIDRMGKAA